MKGAPPIGNLAVRTGLPEAAIDAALVERVEAAGAGEALWLTRAQTRRRALEGNWLRRRVAGFRGLFATLPEWVRERYDRLVGRLPLISRPEQLRLLQRLLAEEAAARADHPFRQAERRNGLVDRFRQLVANLKQEGARTERDASRLIRRMEGAREGQSPFLHDPVTRVFGAYAAALARLGLADDEDPFFRVADELVAEGATDAPRTMAAAPRLLVVEGYYHLNAVQRRVLEALARRAEETIVLMDGVFEGGRESAGVDAVWRDEVAFWRDLGARFEPRGSAAPTPMRDALARFGRREALATAAATDAGQCAPAHLVIARYARPLDELRGIARAIRGLRSRPGGEGARIAVMFPSLEAVATLAEEVFLRYEIPFRVIDRVRVAATAPARALRDLIDALAGGFTRQGVMALVLSPLVEIAGLGAREELARLDLALRNARFHGGRGAGHWGRRIGRRLARLARDEEALLDVIADAGGPAADCVAAIESADTARDIAAIARSREELAALIRSGRRLASDIWPDEGRNPDAAAREWLVLNDERLTLEGAGARLAELLERWEPLRALRNPLDLAEGVIESYKSLNLSAGLARCAERSLGAAAGDAPLSERLIQRDLRAWRQTAQAVGEVGRLLALEGGEHPFDAFCRQVQEVLAVEEIDLAEPDDPREVVVLSRLDARQMRFDHVFLGGATAEAVPGRQKANIFFGEEERRLVGWRTHDDTIDEWRHVLAMLAAGAGRLHLSWSGAAVEAPSLLAQELCEAFGVAWRDAQSTAATVATEPAYAARDVALRLARDPKAGATRLAGAGAVGHTRRQRTVRVRVEADAMRRRVDVANERAAPPALSRHDGLIDIDDPALGRARQRAARLGITALERYAACGWEAWARHVVDLAPLPELGDTPERHEQGSIVHRALAEMSVATAQAAGGWPEMGALVAAGLGRRATAFHDALPGARARADEVLHEEAEEFADADAFWRGRVARLALGLREAFDATTAPAPPRSIDRARGPLDNLTHFLATRLGDFAPLAVEAAIGVARPRGMVLADKPVELRLPEDEARAERHPFSSVVVSVRGIVDRIDLVGVGGRMFAVVFDYKTGRGGDQREINAGRRFQLPLYLAAAVAALRARGADVEAGGGVYLGIGDGEMRLSGFATPELAARLRDARFVCDERRYAATSRIHPVAAMDTFLGACVANAARARDAALRGRFPTSWVDARRCGECDLRRICRNDEQTRRGWWRAHRHELAALGLYAPHDLEHLAPPPPRR